jgi:hypothetical protein
VEFAAWPMISTVAFKLYCRAFANSCLTDHDEAKHLTGPEMPPPSGNYYQQTCIEVILFFERSSRECEKIDHKKKAKPGIYCTVQVMTK